ncbi:MAG: transposase [Acidobacteria bacterium]|nr:transposase [Acidobacteriota bacterium]MBP7866932.1 transposase [Acidobacteriota bacterium]
MQQPGPTARFYRKRLPHWEVENGTYFVTVGLFGALPPQIAAGIRRIAGKAAGGGDAGLRKSRAGFLAMENWLHRFEGRRDLENPRVASEVEAFIRENSANGFWEMHAWVLMPNHAHLLFTPTPACIGACPGDRGTLEWLMSTFKRVTARRVNRSRGTRGMRFWQREWFDHWVRCPAEFERIVAYIRLNPVRACLASDAHPWPHLWVANP